MAVFDITIIEASQLAGITAAREAYNADLPDAFDAEGNAVELKPGSIDTDAAYVQFVMERAAAGYALQDGT